MCGIWKVTRHAKKQRTYIRLTDIILLITLIMDHGSGIFLISRGQDTIMDYPKLVRADIHVSSGDPLTCLACI